MNLLNLFLTPEQKQKQQMHNDLIALEIYKLHATAQYDNERTMTEAINEQIAIKIREHTKGEEDRLTAACVANLKNGQTVLSAHLESKQKEQDYKHAMELKKLDHQHDLEMEEVRHKNKMEQQRVLREEYSDEEIEKAADKLARSYSPY
jgi:hypothetical protein